MTNTTEEALLMAIENRDDLFESLEAMLTSDNYLKALVHWKPEQTQQEIADRAGVGRATVSRAEREFKELGLIEENEEGEEKTLPVLDHPLLQHFFEEEYLNDA